MRLLAIDIETTPMLVHTWGLWDQNVGLNQILGDTEMFCFAAKWIGEGRVDFYSTHKDGKESMVEVAHGLLDEADAVVHWNGKRFDVPHLNREFLLASLGPPSPYKQIDLMSAVKKQFKFPSNKLDYVSRILGAAGKVRHEGHELWIKCMAGDDAAWRRMAAYNRRDVALLEDLYNILLPWIPSHPNVALYEAEVSATPSCPKCGSTDLIKQGFRYTQVGRYQQYQCRSCGSWSSVGKRESGVDLREAS